MRRLKSSLLVLFALTICAVFVWPVVAQRQNTPAERVFKNIQVLKGVPASDVTDLMDNFNEALGVNCEYCHVPNALEKGDKREHKIAVQMIKMTRDMHERYKIDVDCMSCHQGKPKPPHLGMNMAGGTKGLGQGGTPDLSQNVTPAPKPATPTTPKPATPTTPKPATPKPSSGQGPTKVVFKASYGDVPFDHTAHSGVTDCATCHHTGEMSKCSTCHQKKPSAATEITAKAAAHNATSERSCTGCHKKQSAGPTKCTECHKK